MTAMARYHAELLLDIYDKQNKQFLLDDAYIKFRKVFANIENYKLRGKALDNILSIRKRLVMIDPVNIAQCNRTQIEDIQQLIGQIHQQAESDVLKFLNLT